MEEVLETEKRYRKDETGEAFGRREVEWEGREVDRRTEIE